MRHNNNNRNRMKGRNNNNNGQRRGNNVPPRMQVFDSNGPDVRIRGTAWQVHEKYLALAKDAAAIGDVVVAENYLQHAEHYQRIINSFGEQVSNWVPQSADNDDASMQVEGAGVVTQQPYQQQAHQQQVQQQGGNNAPRADRRDDAGNSHDLGLPSSLFKPTTTAPVAALETA